MSPTPQPTPIDGALVVPLQRHADARGWFLEARRESWFEPLGGKPSRQTNIVWSRQGVIRGLHYHELGQDDLFFCALGMVRVVLFDRREDSPTHGVAWSIDIGEDGCILYEAAFDDFPKSGPEVFHRQRLQECGVAEHSERVMECTDEVFAGCGIDSGLAAHGSINHSEQGAGHMNDINPAQPGCCNKASNIRSGTSTYGDDRIRPRECCGSQSIPTHLKCVERFS